LRKLRIGNARERRVLAYMMQFNLILHYVQGHIHVSSDYLARWPAEMTEGEQVTWQSKDDDVLDDYLFTVTTNEIDPHADDGVGQWQAYFINSPSEI